MVDPIWSWWLTAFAVTAIWVGPHHRWGWIVGAIGQGLWFVYGIHSHQHGFVVSALLLAAGYIRNFVSAGKKHGRLKRVRSSSSRSGIVRAGLARAQRKQPQPRNPRASLWSSLRFRPMLLLLSVLLVA